MTKSQLIGGASLIALAFFQPAVAWSEQEATTAAETMQNIMKRLEQLEKENKAYKTRLEQLEAGNKRAIPAHKIPVKNNAQMAESSQGSSDASDKHASNDQEISGVVRINSNFSYDMLDPTTNINRKQLYLLEQKQQGNIAQNGIYFGGAVTAFMNFWDSNRDSKFGYLMRHPTPNNQIGETVTEAGIHSAQVSFMANMGDWITAYGELLYDPQQSFGAGTITAVSRNQIQLRKGYVTIGNLDKSPLYLTLGKMATPFGLTDTVSPFSSTSGWHAFGGLAYGVMLGYSDNGLNVRAELVQGGAQFRAANVPVNGTSVPSRLNNYVIDASYTFNIGGDNDTAMVGGSYERGSTYCQDFPVVHFNPCDEPNPAWAVYGKLNLGQFTLIGEFNKTTDVWPGTFNPAAPLNQFAASKVSSLTVGGKYETSINDSRTDFSLEFSTFNAGADGAPWERQNQWVLGGAFFLTDTVKLFAEGVLVKGYSPLNFISGGNMPAGQTHSDRDARSTGVVLGVNVAY